MLSIMIECDGKNCDANETFEKYSFFSERLRKLITQNWSFIRTTGSKSKVLCKSCAEDIGDKREKAKEKEDKGFFKNV